LFGPVPGFGSAFRLSQREAIDAAALNFRLADDDSQKSLKSSGRFF
jgi:cbb3-type cytochrome oxidase subunit 3